MGKSIATDSVRIYKLMSLSMTPAPTAGTLTISPAEFVTLTVGISDPDSASPYVIAWTKAPFATVGPSFSAPAAATTQFGPLVENMTYYITVSVTAANGQVATYAFRLIVTA